MDHDGGGGEEGGRGARDHIFQDWLSTCLLFEHLLHGGRW